MTVMIVPGNYLWLQCQSRVTLFCTFILVVFSIKGSNMLYRLVLGINVLDMYVSPIFSDFKNRGGYQFYDFTMKTLRET